MTRDSQIGSARNTLESGGQFNAAWFWMAVLLIAAGLATRRSVLFVVAACLLTVVPVAWLWKTLSLRNVEYERRYDRTRAFPGETVNVEIRITNRKLLPLTWLEATDEVPTSFPLIHGHLLPTHDPKMGLLRNVLALRWYERYSRHYELACTARGAYSLGPVHLRSGDLFTLFEERVQLGSGEPLIVYPRIWPIADLGIPAKEPFGERPPTLRLLDDPLRSVGVRDHRPEDSLRHVHWKATAHRGRLQVRVHEPAATPTLMIVLNVSTFEHHWQGVLPDLFERTISVAGSVATWATGQGYKVGLVANGCVSRSDQPVRVPPGRSPGQLTAILESLARVTSFATASVGELLRRESQRTPWGATFVTITAVVTHDLPAALYSLRRAGRPVALISLAAAAPPKLDGIRTYHLAPETPVFRADLDGAGDATAALEAAGLMGRRRWDPIAGTQAYPSEPHTLGLDPVGGTA